MERFGFPILFGLLLLSQLGFNVIGQILTPLALWALSPPWRFGRKLATTAATVVGYLAVMSAIAHKEPRFFLPVVPALIALIQSIAAGALLVVVVNEMVPIAIRGVARRAGIIAATITGMT